MLMWGTVTLRPYVFVFLGVFAILAARDLGVRRALVFLAWGLAVALVAEYSSTRIGIPFGVYHYTGATVGRELYASDVPLFDPLSFPFLAYAAWCLARWASGQTAGVALAGLAGILMMLLDMVIDPLAVRGDQWFLGRIFFYPEGGAYFGVPLSNFLGWAVVGWVIIAGYVWMTADSAPPRGPAHLGAGLYYGVFLFNWTLTVWIGELMLAAVGFLVHGALFLILYFGFARRWPLPTAGGQAFQPAQAGGPEGIPFTS